MAGFAGAFSVMACTLDVTKALGKCALSGKLRGIGVFLFSMRLLWGCRQVAILRRSGETADDTVLTTISGLARRLGLTRLIGVLISPAADGPSVAGWLRPVILLPASTMLG